MKGIISTIKQACKRKLELRKMFRVPPLEVNSFYILECGNFDFCLCLTKLYASDLPSGASFGLELSPSARLQGS
jgi:hypothetical protein